MKRVQKWLTSLFAVLLLAVGTQCCFAKTAEISIPSSFGEVKESFKGTSGKSVVHIQDAHCNYDAQISIANIIKQLVVENKIDLVALEGAKGIVDTSIFKAIPDEKVKELVADYFVRQGAVNGADLASATADNNFTLWGVENKDLYFQNRNSFLSSLQYRSELEEKTSKIKWLLSQLKEKTFSGEAKDLFATIEDYNKDRISLSSYCTYLKDVAEKNSITWSRYENYSQIVKIVELEDSIDFSQIEADRLKVVEILEKKLKKEDVSELVSQSLYFRLGKTDAKKYYNYLSKLAKDNNVDLAKQTNLVAYIELVNLYDEVNSDKLFSELEQLEGDIKAVVYKSKEEKDLDSYFKNISILSNLCGLKMTRKDLTYFNDHKKSFVVDNFVSFIRKEMVRQNLSFPIDEDLKVIEQVMPELEKFYELAIKRDDVMVDNLLSKMDTMKSESAILVTGGFHSDGILQRLKAQDISYTVVTPKINTIGNTEEIYLNQISSGAYGAGVGFGMLAVMDKLNAGMATGESFAAFQQYIAGVTENVSGAVGVNIAEFNEKFLTGFVAAMKQQQELAGQTVNDADLRKAVEDVLKANNVLGQYAVIGNNVSYTFVNVNGKLGVQVVEVVNNVVQMRVLTEASEIANLNIQIASTDTVKAVDVMNNIKNDVALDTYTNAALVKAAFSHAAGMALRKILSDPTDDSVVAAVDNIRDVLMKSDQVAAVNNESVDLVTTGAIDLVKSLMTKDLTQAEVAKLDGLLSKVRLSALSGEVVSDDQKATVSQSLDNPYEMTVKQNVNGKMVDSAITAAIRDEAAEVVSIVVTQQLIDDVVAGKAAAIAEIARVINHETAEMAFANNHDVAKSFDSVIEEAALKLAASANIDEASKSIKDMAVKADKTGNGAEIVAAITKKALAGEAVGGVTIARNVEAKIDNDMQTEEATNLTPAQQKEIADAAVVAAEGKLGVQDMPALVEKTYQDLAAANNMTVRTLNLATGPVHYLLDEVGLQAKFDALTSALSKSREDRGLKTAEQIVEAKIIHATARKAAPIILDTKTGNPTISAELTGKFIDTINKRSNGNVKGTIYVTDADVAAVAETLGVQLSKASIAKLYEEAFAAYKNVITVKEVVSVQDIIDSNDTKAGDVILVAAAELKDINGNGKKVIGTTDETNFARMADMIEEALTNDLAGMVDVMKEFYGKTLMSLGIKGDAYTQQMADFAQKIKTQGVFAFLEVPVIAVVEQLNFELITAVQVDIAA